MERFFLEQKLLPGKMAITDPEILHKLLTVLRLERGDQIAVFGLDQKEYLAEISALDKKSVELQLAQPIEKNTEARLKLLLYPSLIKKNRFEILLEKCTEIGAVEFRPVISGRSVVKAENSPERWRKIVIEAAQQSGRVVVPEIKTPLALEQALNQIKAGKIAVGMENVSEPAPLSRLQSIGEELHLFIGPEGGWTETEKQLFEKHRAIAINLGARILRAETAAIALSALAIYSAKE